MSNNYPNGSYRSSRSKPCPVCGRTKDGDCAVDVLGDGQVKVRCHTHLGDAGVAGFVYRGLTDCGTWGLYFSLPDDREVKGLRPAGRVEFFYPSIKGDPLVKVMRVDDGQGNKKFSQWHRQYGKGMGWAVGCPASFQKQLHLYRIGDELNQSAIRNGDPLLVVEGEGKVDLLMSIGIAATCSIGGAGKWRRYGYPNYLQDLEGANLVLVPDRDTKGMAHMRDIDRDFPSARWLYPFPDSPLWHRLPDRGGVDVADWIADFKLGKDEILACVGKVPTTPTVSQSIDDEDGAVLRDESLALLAWSGEAIDVESLLPSLARPLRGVAQAFNIPAVVLVAALLPICASLMRVGTRIAIAPQTEFYPPPILWTGIIAESGATKSPIFRILTKPLKLLQAEAEELYRERLKDYERAIARWDVSDKSEEKPAKPIPRNFFFQDFTIEGLAQCLEGSENGTLIAVDELAEMLAGFNQYRNGKGNDRQKWLTIYDSGGMKVDRSSGRRMFLLHTQVSVLGTIQPDVLREQMGDLAVVDGLWQRFLWVHLPVSRLPAPGDGVACDVSELLLGLYRRLYDLPAVSYGITAEGRKLWREWHDWCETEKLAEGHPSVRSLYPKARERAARIALLLHVVDALALGDVPDSLVSADTLAGAIALARWTINQTRLLYADLGIAEHRDSARIARFVQRFRGAGWVSPRQVRSWFSGRVKPNAKECREFMELVVALGYGVGNGLAGKDFRIRINPDFIDCSPFSPKQPQTQIQHEFDCSPNCSPFLVHSSPDFDCDRSALPHSADCCGAVPQKNVEKTDYADYRWTKKRTKPESSPSMDLMAKRTNGLRVGDRVRYRGRGENGLFTLKGIKSDVLTVLAVTADSVEVSSPKWLSSQSLPIADVEVCDEGR